MPDHLSAGEFWRPILHRLLNRRFLPCLSIKQPWPYRIFYEGKDVENRSWETKFRRAFLVHAGKTPDCPKKYWTHRDDMPLGCICGLAYITDCVDQWASEWFVGPYGFVLDHRKLLFQTPLPYRGQLGFFDVPCELVREALNKRLIQIH